MKRLIYIVVVTYNGIQWIDKCLGSIDFSTYQVVVVDNNSTDQTVNFISKNYPSITLLAQDKNLGFGQANNLGISHALQQGAEYVFLLNQDAYLYPDTITNLIEVYKTHPEYGIISPIHLNGEGTKLDKTFSFFVDYNHHEYFYFDAIKKQLEPVYDIPFVNAAAWLLPKTTLLNIGGFDPLFFHYGEDNNYCQRVLFHGYKIGVATNAFVKHDREIRKHVRQTHNLLFSEKYFKEKELAYKIKYADLNFEDAENAFVKELKKIERMSLKFLFKLKIKHYKGYKKLGDILKSVYAKSVNSKELNQKKNSNYI
ncbi:glycosyltransferase family 2 protein [Mesoflavibacter zeaxanthinifaciens]|uniref:glycosyltransferase family 2 protein n=1 Tax=Mesoflavibacter zeaxanthinifaciens TaxID=393060 RepID=UPI0004843507|nr:glycosyltransferase family 2 protein [Mesoflavibacter zeaxanthinifaciens]